MDASLPMTAVLLVQSSTAEAVSLAVALMSICFALIDKLPLLRETDCREGKEAVCCEVLFPVLPGIPGMSNFPAVESAFVAKKP